MKKKQLFNLVENNRELVNFREKDNLFITIFEVFTLAILLATTASAQVSGIVFRDFNANGTRETTPTFNEIGIPAITVTAYNSAGTSVSTTTASDGTYSFANSGITAAGQMLRIEFTNLATGDYPGAGGGTSVQFITAGVSTTNVDFGVNYPMDYLIDETPKVALPCYVGGSRQSGSNFANLDVFVSYPWTNAGQTTMPSHDANYNTLGAVWGTAFQRSSQKMFASAFLKRHSSLGPSGLGAIYLIDYSGGTPVVSPFMDLKAAPYSLNLGTFDESDATRGLSGTTSASRDTEAFGKVAKVGLGGLAISDDETTLYSINLFEKKLIKINLGLPTTTPLATDVTEYLLPTPVCNLGTSRPFAVAFYKGMVYVGMVCSAENGGTVNDMFAYVYSFSPTSATFSLLSGFPIPLNYTKGPAHYSNSTSVASGTAWNPWSDIATNHSIVLGSFIVYPTPVLSDIDFTPNGMMVLGFMDRASNQWGYQNMSPDATNSALYYNMAGGDILMAAQNAGTWTLENNASVGGLTGCGAGNNEGPGGGEFFCHDQWGTDHHEIALGGNVVNVARNTVKASLYDPITYDTGGTSDWSLSDGSETLDYQLFSSANPGTFGKAAGLGELEILGSPAPIEIGNRIWDDTDKDGIQDANEIGIGGITVTLCLAATPTTPVATATTDANGNYYFSSATGTSTTSAIYGINLSYNTNYILKFPTTFGTKLLTTQNAGSNDLIDSDVNAAGQIALAIGTAGQNNHSFDVGYICNNPTATASATQPTCTGTNAPNNGSITIAGFTTNQRYQYSSGTTFNSGGAVPSSITVIPSGGVLTSTLPNTTSSYTIRIYDATDDACFVDRVISITAVVCCTIPTHNTPTTLAGTCTGSTLNNDASITITGITGDKIAISTAGATSFDGSTYTSAHTVSAGSYTFSGLQHGANYIIRIYNLMDTCYKAITITTPTRTCCPSPNCGTISITKN